MTTENINRRNYNKINISHLNEAQENIVYDRSYVISIR